MLTGGTLIMMVMSILLMADSFVAGAVIGSDAVAGITLVTPLYSLAIFFASVISIGIPFLYSTEMGKFNKTRADQAFGFGILMSFVAGIVLFILTSFFGDVYLRSYSPSQQVLDCASEYLYWMRFTILVMPIQMLVGDMVYSDGDETISNIANVVQGLGNIVFSVILCRVMGIRGIGLASFLFYVISLLVFWCILLKRATL